MITPTAHLVPQGARSAAKQNAYYCELSHQNGMVLGNMSVDKCLQNLFSLAQAKQPSDFFHSDQG